jgi:hypothetical protein
MKFRLLTSSLAWLFTLYRQYFYLKIINFLRIQGGHSIKNLFFFPMSAEHVGVVQYLDEQCRLNLSKAQLHYFKHCAMNITCQTAVFMCNRTSNTSDGLHL